MYDDLVLLVVRPVYKESTVIPRLLSLGFNDGVLNNKFR
jgi:hypothetical protein